MGEKIFADGFGFKKSDSQPSFVVGKVTIRVDAAIKFINEHQKDNWINLDIKKSSAGKYYLELDTYDRSKKNDDSVEDARSSVNKTTKNSRKNDIPDYQEHNDFSSPESDDLPF